VLVALGQHLVVDALIGHRHRLGSVAHERQFDAIRERKAPRRIAVHDEGEVGEAILDRIQRLRRRHHRLGQEIAPHAALRDRFHVLAEGHGHVGHQQVGGRHPGVDVQRDLGTGRPNEHRQRSEGAEHGSHNTHVLPPCRQVSLA
jgi:hypothetical protein